MKIVRPTHEEIAARAYHIYLDRGREHGHDRDDWLQAEYELMQLPVRKIAELTPAKALPAKTPAKTPSLVEVVRRAMFLGSSRSGHEDQAAA
jgi:hypothetical protein